MEEEEVAMKKSVQDFSEYIADVKAKKFPEEVHTYRMPPEEVKKFADMLYGKRFTPDNA
jgi:hypothetical protein